MWDDDETYSDFARSQDDFEDNKDTKGANEVPANKQNEFNLLNEYVTSGNNKTDTAAAKQMAGQVNDYYFASMPNNVKHPGRHFLPASASDKSLKNSALDGSLASSGSKRLLNAEEVPTNSEMVVPINFGIKYKPTTLGLEYHIAGQP
jgi:hypothetical protein